MTYATVTKWGNSLAIRIPQAFATQIGVKENSNVSLELIGDRIVIRRGKSLDEMLESVTADNKHTIVEFGEPRGKEAI